MKHQLEYNIWSAKVSWCPICNKHFYNERNEKHTTLATDEHYHIVEDETHPLDRLVIPKIADLINNPSLKVKINGDAGEYEVWAIDWLNQRMQVYRATVYEWIPFNKIDSNFSE